MKFERINPKRWEAMVSSDIYAAIQLPDGRWAVKIGQELYSCERSAEDAMEVCRMAAMTKHINFSLAVN